MTVEISVDNRIRISLDSLSSEARKDLEASCEHENPEFSKKRKLGYSTYGVPAVIRTWRHERGKISLPRGAMSRVREVLSEYGYASRVRDARSTGAAAFERLDYVGHEPRTYQRAAVDAVLAKEQGVIRAATGCLSGDTLVELNRAGKSFSCELRHLVAMHAGGKASGKTWDPEIETRVRMRTEDGYVRLGTVLDAYSSGRKRTFRVITRGGRTIRATLDHRFLSSRGWRRLGQLRVGDRVYVDGGIEREERERKAKASYLVQGGLIGHPNAGRRGVRPERGGWSVPKHRLVVEAEMNGLSYERFVDRLKEVRYSRKRNDLLFLPPGFHVHHEDENPKNNDLSNLVVKPMREHAADHGRDGGWRRVTAKTVLDEIVSIGDPEEEETYDVEILEEEHNFLADGFVVHNSGKTTTAIYAAYRINEKGMNTLIVLPSVELLRQTREVAARLLGVGEDEIGTIQGSKKKLRALTVATQQTLWSRTVDEDVRGFFGAVIVDEAHHAAARTFQEVIDQFPCRYRVALTADERRKDRKEFLVYDAFGKPIHEMTREACEALGVVVDVEVRVVFSDYDGSWYRRDPDFNRLLERLTEDEERNELIAGIAAEELAAGEQVIICTHRREHVRVLDSLAAEFGYRSGRMLGGQEATDEADFAETRNGLRDGSVRLGVGTYGALGEGIDLPAVAVGIAATPITSNKQKFNQFRGRLCRPSAGKKQGRLYVVFDRRVFDERAFGNILAWNRTVTVRRGNRWVDARALKKNAIMAIA